MLHLPDGPCAKQVYRNKAQYEELDHLLQNLLRHLLWIMGSLQRQRHKAKHGTRHQLYRLRKHFRSKICEASHE